MSERQLVLIVGPTAVGKTELCVKLARHFKCDIISADSRQFYRELSIGTAKPSVAEMDGIPHHFINNRSISEPYSAGDFERDALRLLDELFQKSERVIMTGGSGLFVKAITHGLDNLPEIPAGFRSKLMERLADEGVSVLAGELRELDPVYFATIDSSNSQRVVRALEVCLFTGMPFSGFHKNKPAQRNFVIKKIALARPREILYDYINKRVDKMLTDGLVAEAESVITFRNQNALQTVGYKEVYSFLDGEIGEKEMRELIQRNTRRYAKRQLTWFKNQDDFTWFHPGEFRKIVDFINS